MDIIRQKNNVGENTVKTILFSLCFLLLQSFVLYAQDIDKALLKGYEAALVIHNRASGEVINPNPAFSSRRLSPCSTFKIYNTLIGLELGLIQGPDEPWYQWDGVHRAFKEWNRDLTLREAFQVSCVPAYQTLARQIGEEKMKGYIGLLDYGTKNIASGIDTFWLPRPETTSIMISAEEQVALLDKLLEGDLPFSRDTISVLRSVMEVGKTEQGTLYGEPGSGLDDDGKANLGWFVGFLDTPQTTYTFACNIMGGDNPSGKTARGIVEDVLRSIGLF